MKIKGLQDEDFVNYKKPSMFIGTSLCDWKCCNEQCLDKDICQNSSLANSKTIDISADEIYRRYINNPITKAVVIGGLEPILQFTEVLDLIYTFRNNGCFDDFVIYTGYYPSEIKEQLKKLFKFNNIIIKFGRYIPHDTSRHDEVLGINLASSNQFAQTIEDIKRQMEE